MAVPPFYNCIVLYFRNLHKYDVTLPFLSHCKRNFAANNNIADYVPGKSLGKPRFDIKRHFTDSLPKTHRRFSCIFGKSSYTIASAISQLVDTVRGSMLLNIVTFGYTEVYPANQMIESCEVGYTLIRWP